MILYLSSFASSTRRLPRVPTEDRARPDSTEVPGTKVSVWRTTQGTTGTDPAAQGRGGERACSGLRSCDASGLEALEINLSSIQISSVFYILKISPRPTFLEVIKEILNNLKNHWLKAIPGSGIDWPFQEAMIIVF